MSVEITYDPTDVDAGEFSPDEMDSLQLGEQLEQAENQMLAGKYANAEQLEQAYLNLQQKMGEQSTDEEYESNEEYEDEPDGDPSYEYDSEFTIFSGKRSRSMVL